MPKCDDDIKIHCYKALKNDLFRLAEQDGRTLSDYLRYQLELHVYGHRKRLATGSRGAMGEHEGISGNIRALPGATK